MLTSTFCHIPGVGEKTERALWSAGLTTWDALLGQGGCSPYARRTAWLDVARESLRQHAAGNPAFFADRLPAKQHWRLYRDFRDSCAFVDIGTTGLSYSAEVTTIALYDGRALRTYVNGHNLDSFADDVRAYRLLVTYNGKCFDAPVLEAKLGVRLPAAHLDMRQALRSLGLTGGLKGCERALGIARPGLEEVDGLAAVLLWQEYRCGDERALEALLAYNARDAVNLRALAVYAYNERLKRTPFAGSHALPACGPAAVPFRADAATVGRVLRRRARLLAAWGARRPG
jgi:uncharacterized protein YprB with RNaseH-like and TPR domain